MLDIELVNLENHTKKFSEIISRAEVTLFLFYHTSCLGCTGRAIPLAYDFQKEYKELQVILVHSELAPKQLSKEEILSVFVNNESPLPIFIDRQHKLYDLIEAEGTPFWVLIKASGEIINKIFGSQQNAQNRLHYSLMSLKESE